MPRCVVIAGPNGARNMTFAGDFRQRKRGIERFVNADLIAAGNSPLNPAFGNPAAARVFFAELDRLAAGYRVEIVILRLPSVELARPACGSGCVRVVTMCR